jgi:hypothetical protein
MSHVSVLYPTLYNMYINDDPQSPSVHLALFADYNFLYATDRKENFAAETPARSQLIGDLV